MSLGVRRRCALRRCIGRDARIPDVKSECQPEDRLSPTYPPEAPFTGAIRSYYAPAAIYTRAFSTHRGGETTTLAIDVSRRARESIAAMRHNFARGARHVAQNKQNFNRNRSRKLIFVTKRDAEQRRPAYARAISNLQLPWSVSIISSRKFCIVPLCAHTRAHWSALSFLFFLFFFSHGTSGKSSVLISLFNVTSCTTCFRARGNVS